MVSNFDRIYSEITAEAERVAPECGLTPKSLSNLVMEIVYAEDSHRVKPIEVNKDIENLIANAALGIPRN